MIRVIGRSLPVLAIIGTAVLASMWARSWADQGFETMDCAGGSYFLADLGWGIQGMLLGAAAAVTVVVVATITWSFPLAIASLIVAGVAAGWAADVGGAAAAAQVGCDAFYTREAGGAITFGMAIGAVPTILVTGLIVLVRTIRHPRDPVAVPDAVARGFDRKAGEDGLVGRDAAEVDRDRG